MTMAPGLRKIVLTAHVTFSVGWLGAVAGFLALAIAGLISRDSQMSQASYISMELITWYVIIPLSLTSLLTGLVQSLGTRWGLFRHYWVMILFLFTVFSIVVLLAHLQPISLMTNMATKASLSETGLRGAQVQLVVAPVAALLVLLVSTALAIYKPKGMTHYGQRKLRQLRNEPSA